MSEQPKPNQSLLEAAAQIDVLRVSCANLVAIAYGPNYVLSFNRSSLRKGKHVLTPIGGRIQANQAGQQELIQRYQLANNSFDDEGNLAFLTQGKYAKDFLSWFKAGQDRELTPERELEEELVGELQALNRNDLASIALGSPFRQAELSSRSTGHNEGYPTLRLIEVFPARANQEVIEKLVACEMIRLVHSDEILAGVSKEGHEIGSNALALIGKQTKF